MAWIKWILALHSTSRFTAILCSSLRKTLGMSIYFASIYCQAAPWVNAGDERVRHHLQSLVDSGVLSTPVTTWPMMWVNIKNALEQLDPSVLSSSQLWSYQFLKHELRFHRDSVSFDHQVFLSNSDVALTEFSSDAREEYQIDFALNYTGDQTAMRIQINYAHEPTDRQEVTLSGSYLSHLIGNWAVGVGAIDRWWGPGWQASMILTQNAKPTPGLFVQRNRAEPFDLPILRHLGPWQLTTFMSQLESNRDDYPSPLLWGMRLNFRPLKSLEIGLSRTAMWAGDGRPGDADTFLNLLLGRDNRGDGDTTEENEPGNQLAGVDLRWNGHWRDYSFAAYGQLIGEDEANGTPSRHIGLAGLELQSRWNHTHWRAVLETHNSQMYFYDHDKKTPNAAYEHTIYTDGYRYRGRTLGASTDNDTESVVLRGYAFFDNGHSLTLGLARHRLNFDGTSRNNKAPFGAQAVTTTEIKADYSLPLNNHYALTIGGFYYTEDVIFQSETINLGGYLQLNARW